MRGTAGLEPEQLEQPPRTVARTCARRARARARARPSPPPAPGSSSSSRYAASASVGVVDDDELAARLEPALDARVRVRDDRGAGRSELERPAGRRAGDGRVRAARDVEVDPRGRDRAREDVERHVADQPRAADVAPEVAAAEREVDPRVARGSARRPSPPSTRGGTCRRSRRRRRPLLLDRLRREELRVGAPRRPPRRAARRARAAARARPRSSRARGRTRTGRRRGSS